MPIEKTHQYKLNVDLISDWAMQRMRELYGEKFPNMNQQIRLEKEISDFVELQVPFLPEYDVKIIINQKTEIPFCYVKLKEEKE